MVLLAFDKREDAVRIPRPFEDGHSLSQVLRAAQDLPTDGLSGKGVDADAHLPDVFHYLAFQRKDDVTDLEAGGLGTAKTTPALVSVERRENERVDADANWRLICRRVLVRSVV